MSFYNLTKTNMKNSNDNKESNNKALLLFMLFWLGVLTGAVAALVYMQGLTSSDMKSNILYTPVENTIPTTFKPGPVPWMPTLNLWN